MVIYLFEAPIPRLWLLPTMSQSAFSDLRVWQSAMDLVFEIYQQTSNFPKNETYGLTQQMRRAAVLVPSNIAEGKGRRTAKDFSQFLYQARGSLLELQTQTIIAKRLGYLSEKHTNELLKRAAEVGRGLAGLINSLTPIAA
jgi:four helix bundle protein